MIGPTDRTVVVDGLRLHLLDWGGNGRPPLLLLHGFTGSARALDTLAIALQPHFHVWALDQRGHGDSDPAEVYGPRAAFGDLSGVIDQLGLAPLGLVGFSMGGRNAMYFASRRPADVRRLVVVDIGPQISARAAASVGEPEPEAWDSVEQAAQHLLRGNPYPGIHYFRWVVSHSLRARPDGRLVWKWHPSIKERRDPGADLDWWAVLRAIPMPTLVLRGAESPILDRDVGERMARELPRGRFVEIPRAVHMLHEDNPEAVVEVLRSFLLGAP